MRRLMFIEDKSGGLEGPSRIGWVEVSRTFRSYRYGEHRLLKTGSGYKYNCVDEATGAEFWVSGPSKTGADKLYGGMVEVDEDAREEYWIAVRGAPDRVHLPSYRSAPSTRTEAIVRRVR